MNFKSFYPLIEDALKEDIPYDDITSDLIEENLSSKAYIICKEDCVLCGIDLVFALFRYIDKEIKLEKLLSDGERVSKGKIICNISGNTRGLLKGERVALNLLSYLSGIATQTASFVEIIDKYNVKLLDTRKTLPLYRSLAKYAVKIGGGFNHRYSLSDMILIKDNHIKAVGGISNVMEALRNGKNHHPFAKVEIEVKNLKEAMTALMYSPDVIMLDNFTISECEEALTYLRGKVEVEISGGINLSNIEKYAKLKPDYISVGSITHSVKAIDFSLEIE